MSYFPIMIQLEDRRVLVIGGGKIASDKVEKLLCFTKNITIISKEFSPTLLNLVQKYNLKTLAKIYEKGDIKGFDIVVVATDEVELQKRIYLESRDSRVLVNSVDDTNYCDFIFPSFIKKGDLIVSFSTSGVSPALSKHLRLYFQRVIPDSIEDFLKNMRSLRETLPKGRNRMKRFDEVVKEFIKREFKD